MLGTITLAQNDWFWELHESQDYSNNSSNGSSLDFFLSIVAFWVVVIIGVVIFNYVKDLFERIRKK